MTNTASMPKSAGALSKRQKDLITKIVSHSFIIFFGAFMMYPIVWMLGASLSSGIIMFNDPSLFPSNPTFENYLVGWQGVGRIHFSTFMINSAIISFATIAGNLFSCTLAGYAFARLEFTWKKVWFAIMLLTIMLPGQVTLIPQYVMFLGWGWVDTYLPLVVPTFLATNSFFIFLMVQFIRGLPTDLDEAATIEGCNKFGVFMRIILPLCVPALVTVAIFAFLGSWDNFFGALVYINTPSRFTVQLGIRMFRDATAEANWGPMFAMSIVTLMPPLIVFLSLQKYFVQGISTSGLKG